MQKGRSFLIFFGFDCAARASDLSQTSPVCNVRRLRPVMDVGVGHSAQTKRQIQRRSKGEFTEFNSYPVVMEVMCAFAVA